MPAAWGRCPCRAAGTVFGLAGRRTAGSLPPRGRRTAPKTRRRWSARRRGRLPGRWVTASATGSHSVTETVRARGSRWAKAKPRGSARLPLRMYSRISSCRLRWTSLWWRWRLGGREGAGGPAELRGLKTQLDRRRCCPAARRPSFHWRTRLRCPDRRGRRWSRRRLYPRRRRNRRHRRRLRCCHPETQDRSGLGRCTSSESSFEPGRWAPMPRKGTQPPGGVRTWGARIASWVPV